MSICVLISLCHLMINSQLNFFPHKCTTLSQLRGSNLDACQV
jgi:hypothetical protein